MMSGEENKAVVRRFFETLNQGDAAALGSMLADSFVAHNRIPGQEPTREGMPQLMAAIRAGFPDSSVHVRHAAPEEAYEGAAERGAVSGY